MAAILEVPATIVYRRMPPVTHKSFGANGTSGQEQEAECGRKRGHVLFLDGKFIRCRLCPATWKDEGF